MSIYPGAVFKPTTYGGRTKRNRQGRGILHVAVSNARSLPPWNQNTWHFYVAHDGYCEQYVDTDFRAYAAGDANDDAIMIETAGGTGSSAVLNAEKWTPAAAERLADIMAWEAQQPGGAPLELLPDSKPGRRGWGPHRLGIQHSRGIGAVPGWLVPGGERWSSALGKECPGDAKVAQVPQLIARAREILNGDDMPSVEDIWNHPIDGVRARDRLTGVDNQLLGALPQLLSRDPWVNPVSWAVADRPIGAEPGEYDAPTLWEMVLGLRAAVQTLAEAHGVTDAAELLAGVEEIVKRNKATLDVRVSANDDTAA